MCSSLPQLRKPGMSPSAPVSRVFCAVGCPFIMRCWQRLTTNAADLTGNRRVLETVRSLSIPGIDFAETSTNAPNDRGGFRGPAGLFRPHRAQQRPATRAGAQCQDHHCGRAHSRAGRRRSHHWGLRRAGRDDADERGQRRNLGSLRLATGPRIVVRRTCRRSMPWTPKAGRRPTSRPSGPEP